ncbi:MAG TPA: phage terminase large subunit [Acetobacteraceae bacterium]|nr:phage terminase large subunit [Acetobacteraceae bacterium]
MTAGSSSDCRRLDSNHSPRGRIRYNLYDWTIAALRLAEQRPARHHRLLLAELEALARGRFDRLMISMPPGSAKSTYTSVLFPAWWFTRHPRTSVIAVSHTLALAQQFSRRTRETIASYGSLLGYDLLTANRGSGHWRTTSGGEYTALGVRGALTGRRADLIILDDPIRSQLEADNQRQRDTLWEWYRSSLTTRLKPQARVILVMTRWHEDDLGGRLIATNDDRWRQLRLPAIAMPDDRLGRIPGEPLWPEWEDLEALTRKRLALGERTWAALFQQSPRPMEGALFKVECLSSVEATTPTPESAIVRAWDLAATAATSSNDPDWTAGVKLMRTASGHYVILDVIRLQGSPWQVEELIHSTARSDGLMVRIGLPEDPGQAGKSQVTYFAGRLAGYRLSPSRETGSKLTRAMAIASQIEANNVSMIRGNWNRAFIEELRDFPFGRKDDQVDALVRAFSMLIDISEPARRITLPHFSR